MTIAQRIGQVSANVESRTRSAEFIGVCRYLLQAKGGRFEAAELAQQHGATKGIVELLKTGIDPATSTDADFAAPLVPYSNAFAQTLNGLNAFDTILAANAFQRVPLKTRITAYTLAASGDSPSESSAKQISKFSLSQATLEPTKSQCTIVVTNEIAKLATEAAFAWLSDQLRKGLARVTDLTFIDLLINDNSIDEVTSSGSTLSAISGDLATAMALLNIGANSKVYLIAPPKWIRVVALTRTAGGAPAFPNLNILGGDINGVVVLPSDALTDTIILLDAAQGAVGADLIIPSKSTQTSLQMDDNPTDSAQPLVSLWQNNLSAIRLERWWGFELLASDAAVKIVGVSVDVSTGT